jgi:carbon-monoxide dehydrogenase iron sulfur subunit
MNVCPVSAIEKREGKVLIKSSLCIGCGMCAMACPFGVIKYISLEDSVQRRVAVKCDGCKDRVEAGRIPACVEACKTGALVYESIEEYESKKRKRAVSLISGQIQEPEPAEIVLWKDYLSRLYSLNREE